MGSAMKKRKLSHRPDVAAYAASQDLFNALRSATNDIERQKTYLSEARDVVQGLHVDIATKDPSEHDRYIELVLKAFGATARSYANIFHQLQGLTAARPHEGKEERQGHPEFKHLADLTEKAMLAAAEYYADVNGLNMPSHNGATPPEVEMMDIEAEDEDHDLQQAGKGNQASRHNGAPNGGGSKADKVEQQRDKRKQRRAAQKAKHKQTAQAAHTTNHEDTPTQDEPATAPNDHLLATVEYEDINEEVDKRLRQKQEQKEASKKSKKRKRASGDSFNDGVAEVEMKVKQAKLDPRESKAASAQTGENKRGWEEDGVDNGGKKKSKRLKG